MARVIEKLDKPRRLHFDLVAIRNAERTLGMGLHKAINDQLGPTFIVTMLWASFSRDDKALSYRDVEKMVDKALKKRRVSMFELHKSVLEELADSDAFSGYRQEDEDEDSPLASSNESESG